MAIDFGKIVVLAVATAKRVGAAGVATITQPKAPPDAITGAESGSDTTMTADAVQAEASRKRAKSGEAWQQAKAILFLQASGLSFAPAVGYTCSFAALSGRITAVDIYAPAGVAIAYEIAVGS